MKLPLDASQRVPEPSAATGKLPAFTLEIQHRIGQQLAAAYAELNQHDSDQQFASLLMRLDHVFAIQDDHREEKFRREMLENVKRLRKFALSLTKNPTEAEDIVQDTIVRAWRNRKRYKPDTNLSALLFTILRNTFYSRVRKRGMEISDSDGS